MAEPKTTHQSDTLSEISSLSLRAINLVEGLLSGHHRSPHKGSSVEFAEYKDYSPGDDIRHIDWKAFGKTDKYHVKQFEQSTNLKCTILLDTSGSMNYRSPNQRSTALDKREYACTLAAAMSYLLLKQFDAVGLTTFNEKVTSHIPPRSKPSHFQHILHGLQEIKFQGITQLSPVISDLLEGLHGRGLFILISDLLTKDKSILKTLKLICSRGLEVILFHILHPDEVNLPFEGDIVFESLENDPTIGLDPADVRKAYKEVIREQISSFKKNCPSLGIDYLFLDTSSSLEQALKYYLLRRKSLQKL